MPLQKLTRADLAGDGAAGRNVPAEYAAFMRGLKPGDGGRADLAAEGATKITGTTLRFLRSSAGEVKFEDPTKDANKEPEPRAPSA